MLAKSQPNEYLALFYTTDERQNKTHTHNHNKIDNSVVIFISHSCELSTEKETLHAFQILLCEKRMNEQSFSHPICNAGIAIHFGGKWNVIDFTFQFIHFQQHITKYDSITFQNTVT